MMRSEIGRELKVSELKPPQVVFVWKATLDTMATMWALEVGEVYVTFYSGVTDMHFYALRTGPGLEEITDDSRTPIKIFEYLGVV